MGAYELIDLLNSTVSAMVAAFTLYLTMLSAYLVTAYVVGKNLTRDQLLIITIVFLVAVEMFAVGTFGVARRAAWTSKELSSVSPDYPFTFPGWGPYSLLLIMQIGIAASLKFMLDIRRSVNVQTGNT